VAGCQLRIHKPRHLPSWRQLGSRGPHQQANTTQLCNNLETHVKPGLLESKLAQESRELGPGSKLSAQNHPLAGRAEDQVSQAGSLPPPVPCDWSGALHPWYPMVPICKWRHGPSLVPLTPSLNHEEDLTGTGGEVAAQ
jgi:hypothetical protein